MRDGVQPEYATEHLPISGKISTIEDVDPLFNELILVTDDADGKQTMAKWDTRTGRCVLVYQPLPNEHIDKVLVFAHTREFLTISRDGPDTHIFRFWHVDKMECQQTSPKGYRYYFLLSSMTFRDPKTYFMTLNHQQDILTINTTRDGVYVMDASDFLFGAIFGNEYPRYDIDHQHILPSDIRESNVSNAQHMFDFMAGYHKERISQCYSVNFSHDDQLMATAWHDNAVRVYRIIREPPRGSLRPCPALAARLDEPPWYGDDVYNVVHPKLVVRYDPCISHMGFYNSVLSVHFNRDDTRLLVAVAGSDIREIELEPEVYVRNTINKTHHPDPIKRSLWAKLLRQPKVYPPSFNECTLVLDTSTVRVCESRFNCQTPIANYTMGDTYWWAWEDGRVLFYRNADDPVMAEKFGESGREHSTRYVTYSIPLKLRTKDARLYVSDEGTIIEWDAVGNGVYLHRWTPVKKV